MHSVTAGQSELNEARIWVGNKQMNSIPSRDLLKFIYRCMYVFFIRTKYMYNEENTPLCKWNEQQKVK